MPRDVVPKKRKQRQHKEVAAEWVMIKRPVVRTILLIMSYLSIVFSATAFYLAHRVLVSLFWSVSINQFSFDLETFVFWCLISSGILSILLGWSGLAIIQSADTFLRYFGAFGSLISCLLLLASGTSIMNHALSLTSDVDLYCNGGFPDLALIT